LKKTLTQLEKTHQAPIFHQIYIQIIIVGYKFVITSSMFCDLNSRIHIKSEDKIGTILSSDCFSKTPVYSFWHTGVSLAEIFGPKKLKEI